MANYSHARLDTSTIYASHLNAAHPAEADGSHDGSQDIRSTLHSQTDRRLPPASVGGGRNSQGFDAAASADLPRRIDARCPSCGSLERHRLFWLWFAREAAGLAEPILHFAPEKVLAERLARLYARYSTADLFDPADLKLDIENIDLPTATIRTVICNHVLEHVSDTKALGEICRVLSEDGRLIASVPIVEGWDQTYEDDSITTPIEREVHFGQFDHVRYYGSDFRDRLRRAGFSRIDEVTAQGRDVVNYGLLRG